MYVVFFSSRQCGKLWEFNNSIGFPGMRVEVEFCGYSRERIRKDTGRRFMQERAFCVHRGCIGLKFIGKCRFARISAGEWNMIPRSPGSVRWAPAKVQNVEKIREDTRAIFATSIVVAKTSKFVGRVARIISSYVLTGRQFPAAIQYAPWKPMHAAPTLRESNFITS